MVAALLGLLPGLGWSQLCDARERLAFEDGRFGCMSEYILAQVPPAGYSRAFSELLPPRGLYTLAATPGPAQGCPLAVGYSEGSFGVQDSAMNTDGAALSACQAAMARRDTAANCGCQLIVVNGRSLLPRAEFDRRYLNARSAAAEAEADAPTEKDVLQAIAPQRASEPPAPSTPAATPPATTPSAATAPTAPSALAPVNAPTAPAVPPASPPAADSRDEMLAALQKRLQELEQRAMAAAAASAPSPAAAAGVPRLNARALVIGNSRYASFGVLANPQRDARAIAAKLRSFGIEVDLVLDADRDTLIHALNEHSRKASGRDVSILFYAGHGVQVDGINYLIPVNMRADGISSGYIKLAGISLNAALEYLPARTRIVFLDACRDNPATRSLVATRSGGRPGLAPVQAASGTLVAYATRDGATADDGEGSNSPYTTALLRHLDQPVDISLVLRQVRQTVLQLTSGRQEPWEYGSLVGEQIVLPLMAR